MWGYYQNKERREIYTHKYIQELTWIIEVDSHKNICANQHAKHLSLIDKGKTILLACWTITPIDVAHYKLDASTVFHAI